MVRNWWRISLRPVGPTFLWAKMSIWKSSFEPLSTRINRRVHDSASLEWSVSFEAALGLLVGSTAKAVVTDPQGLDPQGLKRQPLLEKRFSQFKTDFAVAPVFLKNVSRIQGLLAAYFFALLMQTLLERELRQAMARAGEASLPLYPEDRPCARPTTHRLIEVFSSIQRHEVRVGDGEAQVMVTKLTKTQRSIIRLLRLDPRTYGLA